MTPSALPPRATTWKLKTRQLEFAQLPAVMGILNVTPDSFSDGGQFFDPRYAVAHGTELAAAGADILDVGGESTRPFATPVSERDELQRVLPVIQALSEQTSATISIDTSKAKVAEEAVAAGAEIINDVTGLSGDPRMLEVAASSGAGVCAMHMHGTPETMQISPESHYREVVSDIHAYLAQRQQVLLAAGLDAERICLDPGIGFGKTHQHNVTLLANVAQFHDLGAPLLVGHSRKGFLAKILGDKELDRTFVTLGVTLALARSGVQVIRVHDVLPTVHALRSFAAVGGIDGQVLSWE